MKNLFEINTWEVVLCQHWLHQLSRHLSSHVITPGLSFLNSSSYNITVFKTILYSNVGLYQTRGLSIPKDYRSLEYKYEKRKGKIMSVRRLKSDMKTLRTAIWFSLAKISSLETKAIEVSIKLGIQLSAVISSLSEVC